MRTHQSATGVGWERPLELHDFRGATRGHDGDEDAAEHPRGVALRIAADAAPSDELGFSVALSSDRVLASARADDGASGSAYVFDRDVNGNWAQSQKLEASDGAFGDQLGVSAAWLGASGMQWMVMVPPTGWIGPTGSICM